MNELSISVTIADRQYRLTVKSEEEETVRKATKLIDKIINEYAVNYAFKDKQDLLAMASLHFATEAVNGESQLTFYENHLEAKLTEIDRILTENIVV